MDKKNCKELPQSRVKESVSNNPRLPNEASVDQLGDEVIGIPPRLLTGLLTGLAGAVVGGVSLPIYFFLREPNHYISPEWLIFVMLGGIAGIFLRLEQPLFRDVYCRKTKTLQQAQVTRERMNRPISFGFEVDLDQ